MNRPVMSRNTLPALGDGREQAETVLMTLAMIIEARDSYTRGHGERMARYATAMGETLGLDDAVMTTLFWGAILHDIGKIGIPDAILLKPGRLTDAEYATMQQHTVIGDEICCPFRAFDDIRRVIRHHHERLDGTGYPDRLRGAQIPLTAQIVGIVDLFDAVTTCRPHKQARSAAVAIGCLREEAARGWRAPALVDVFVETLEAERERSRPIRFAI